MNNEFGMKRSFLSCLVICGVLFVAQYGVELTVAPSSPIAHLVGVLSAQSATEDEEDAPEDPRPERKSLPITIDFFNQNEKITAAIDDEEDLPKAKELLDRSLDRARRWNERELALFHRRYAMLGQSLDDYELMVEHLKKILEYREHVKYFLEEEALWQLATIYVSVHEEFDTALEYIQEWLDLKLDWEEGSKNYAYIAGIYTYKEEPLKTVEWMTRAIDKAQEENLEIRESWWAQLLASYMQLAEEYEDNPVERDKYLQKALDLAKFLVYEHIEKVNYWQILSNVYARMSTASADPEEQSNSNWVYTLEGAYHLGLLSAENDLRRFAAGIQGEEAYIRAAWVYQKGFEDEKIERNFDNLNRYGQSLYLSTDMEKAVEAYEAAVTYKDDARVLHTLASLYQLMENYPKCISFADRALNATENELKQPEQVKFLKGVCQFYHDDLEESEETMESIRAEISEDTTSERLERLRESAGQYIELIHSEQARMDWKEHVENQWREYNAAKARNI